MRLLLADAVAPGRSEHSNDAVRLGAEYSGGLNPSRIDFTVGDKNLLGPAVGARVRERRAALGMAQGELARRMGLSQSGLSGLEKGRPWSLDQVADAAAHLDCDIHDLVPSTRRSAYDLTPEVARVVALLQIGLDGRTLDNGDDPYMEAIDLIAAMRRKARG
jgi:transcriptional regulator with XRE-family HTH domain